MARDNIYTLIEKAVSEMTGTSETYYKEKLRNGLQATYEKHTDELKAGPDSKALAKLTDEAIQIAHEQIPQMALRMYTMNPIKTITVYTEVYDILEKMSKLK
jgi:hypothetical protein